ncbi:MAG: CHC2 zinc finger domain-containing protein, partial [Dolichospermum sp.]
MQIPRLHPDTIEEVKLRADIVDVISEYVVLRKRGKDFVGLCPFHDEKTPSFTVSPYKQMYYCFGCQAAGNAIKFVMDLGKRQFAEVVLDLAKRYQVPVKTLEPEQRQELQRQISLRDQLYT